jgi:hypothetical protein
MAAQPESYRRREKGVTKRDGHERYERPAEKAGQDQRQTAKAQRLEGQVSRSLTTQDTESKMRQSAEDRPGLEEHETAE